MPITIPNRAALKPTMKPRMFPGNNKIGVQNPAPMKVSATGAASTGNALVEPTTVRAGYCGYQIQDNVPAGLAAEDNAGGIVSGAPVDGFAGCVPGSDVFIDATARPAGDQGTFSGLSHTAPTAGVDVAAQRIGFAMTPTKIWFDAV